MSHLGDIAELITALVLLFNSYQNWRNGRKIDQVHKATNSMKDALAVPKERERNGLE